MQAENKFTFEMSREELIQALQEYCMNHNPPGASFPDPEGFEWDFYMRESPARTATSPRFVGVSVTAVVKDSVNVQAE